MRTVLKNARIFVGNGEIIERSSVLVEDGRIEGICKNTPEGSEGVDLSGCTIFPGFIDCHVHLCLDGRPDSGSIYSSDDHYDIAYRACRFAEDTLMAGVTTVRDMGGMDFIDISLRNSINNGTLKGPRILAGGRLICMTGGHGWQIGGREADGPDDMARAVREQVKKGADIIKLMATGGVITPGVEAGAIQLSVGEMSAGVAEARKAGRKTAAHAQSAEGIMNALKAGIDTIEHGYGMNDRIADFMKQDRKAVIPTIKAALDLFDSASKRLIPDFMIKKLETLKPEIFRSIGKTISSGVITGAGTDAGTPFNYHGQNLAEIANLIEFGMPVNRAFQSATLTAAQILGIDSRTGSIEDGKLADIVAFEGNPLEDTGVLTKKESIVFIMKEGKIIKNIRG